MRVDNKMKLIELLDMTLREILEKYCVLFSEECCHTYGITTHDAIGEIAEEYDLCDEPSLTAQPILFNIELLCEFEDENNTAEILTTEAIRQLIENHLPIEKKGENRK